MQDPKKHFLNTISSLFPPMTGAMKREREKERGEGEIDLAFSKIGFLFPPLFPCAIAEGPSPHSSAGPFFTNGKR